MKETKVTCDKCGGKNFTFNSPTELIGVKELSDYCMIAYTLNTTISDNPHQLVVDICGDCKKEVIIKWADNLKEEE